MDMTQEENTINGAKRYFNLYRRLLSTKLKD